MNVPLYIGFGYLVGLGVVGYITLWAWIKERSSRGLWPGWLASCLIGIHFVAGISAVVFVPAFIGHRLRDAQNTLGPILFAATIFALLAVAWCVARDWTRWFVDKRDRAAVAKE
jgi:hypothetical protein